MRKTGRAIRAAWVVSVCLAVGSGGVTWAAGDDEFPLKDSDDGPLVKPDKKPAPTTAPTTQPTTQPAKGGKKPPAKKPGPKKPAPPKPKSRVPEGDPWRESVAAQIAKTGSPLVGPPVLNEKMINEDLYGQVVLVGVWNPSEKEINMVGGFLASLDRRYRSRGLVVIGAMKANPRERLKSVTQLRQRGVSFSVYSGVYVPSEHVAKLDKPPFFFVMDHKGKVLYEGPPSSRIARAVSMALARRPNPILGTDKFLRSRMIVTKIKADRIADAIKLAEKIKGGEGEAAEQAAELIKRIEAYGRDRLAKAARLAKTYPRGAIEEYTQIKKQYAGTPVGETAEAELKKLSEDAKLQKELKAERACLPILAALAKVPRFPYDGDPQRKNQWVQKYGRLVKGAMQRLKTLEKDYAGTRALKEAQARRLEVYEAVKPDK